MAIEVSVIFISHNKYPLNLYSLTALKKQTFDPQRTEVILVDDASTDQTSRLQNYQAPYTFRYIRCSQNEGRSRTKNVGAQAAQGRILIFMDAEMIVDPDFIRLHHERHETSDHLVLTGCSEHYNTYTVLHKDFSKKQFKRYYRLLKKRGDKGVPQTWSAFRKTLPQKFKKKQIKKILSKKRIRQQEYKRYAYPAPFFPHIIDHFGTDYAGYHMPWMFVITHNISVRKSLFEQVGAFDERFNGYGCEDWEFGYRLYKAGAHIRDLDDVKVYHQVHPRNLRNQRTESVKNYMTFFRIHRHFDVGVHALCWMGKNLFEVNQLVTEFNTIMSESPGSYMYVREICLQMFEFILRQLLHNRRIKGRLNLSAVSPDLFPHVRQELQTIKQKGKAPHLVETVEWLLRLGRIQ